MDTRTPERLLREVSKAFETPTDRGTAASQRLFCRTDEGYRFTLSEVGIVFELTHVRRQHGELWAQLTVQCDLAGSRILDDSRTISAADLNFSALRSRQERAKFLADRSQAPECDWPGLVEELSLRLFGAERAGDGVIHLRDTKPADPACDYELDGLYLPRAHPSLIYGSGGALKSYLGLWVAGCLVRRDVRVLYADWELTAADHSYRLRQLFGQDDPPGVLYARCERPMINEADRLRGIVRSNNIQFLVNDSLSFAVHDAPESAETATAYWAAVRRIGIGSVNLGHVAKSGEDAQKTPFGSVFWLNGARSVYNIQRSADTLDAGSALVGLYHRKSNLGPLHPPCSFEFTFSSSGVSLRPTKIQDTADLAAQVSLSYRIRAFVAQGSRTHQDIAEEFSEESADTVRRTVNRLVKTGRLIQFPSAAGGNRLGLPAKQ